MKGKTRNWMLREKAVWASHEVFKRGLKLEEPTHWETKLETWKRHRS